MSINLSRRSLFGTATAAMAADTALRLMTSPFFGKGPQLARIQKAILDGDGTALADAANFTAPANPIFIFTVNAKWDSAGWLSRPNPGSVGITGNTLVTTPSANYSAFQLTQQFGDNLTNMSGTVALGIVPTTTTSGNHVYTGLQTTMTSTGCLSSYVNSHTNSLVPLYFSSVGTADAATATFGPGGSQLITYGTMQGAAGSILSAIAPLQGLPTTATTLLTQLNQRVTADTAFRASLDNIAQRLAAIQTPLQAAIATAASTPATALTATNLTTAAALTANNPLLPQLAAAVPLINLGMASAVTLSIANNDPNGGGDFNNAGGTNVAFGAKSPNQVKALVAQAISQIYAAFPNALVSINSDGGRDVTGGDQQNYEAFIFGPPSLINQTFLNQTSRADSTDFGTTPMTVALSDGTTAVPNQSHVMSTVAKAAGITLGTTPYIPGLLTTAA